MNDAMKRIGSFCFCWLVSAAAAIVATAPASAQDSSAGGAVNAATQQDGLDEVVVTAEKRETNLQQTPIAIAVLSPEAMTDRHVQSLYDLADGTVPSLRVATFEARQTALTIGIRGIVPLDANQPAREQGVGIYIDGVYLGRQHGLNAALLDIDHIEVLKGPQGTLFGRNTEGGALSLVTRLPTGEFGLRSTAGYGDYGAYNADAHLDLPAIGTLSLKLDGVVQYQGETIKNPLAGQKGWNYFDRRGGSLSARWKPADTFTADFKYDVGYDANTEFYSQLLNFNPNNCAAGAVTASTTCVLPGTNIATLSGAVRPLPALIKVQGDSRATVADIGVPHKPSIDKTYGTSLHLNWELASSVELRSISAYRHVSSEQWDNAGGAHRPPVFAANGAFSRYSLADLSQHQFSQEIQVVGSTPRVNYVAGLYYFNETAFDDAATPSSNQWDATGSSYTIRDPIVAGITPGFRSIDRASIAYAKSYAVYGQAIVSPESLSKLHVTVGGRYTSDDKNGRLYMVNNIPRPYTYEQKTSRFNPIVTFAYDATDDVNLYAKYSTGYRSGGASSRSITYRQFDPEDVTAYELGAKTEFLDHRARFNVAAYVMDRKNSQIDFTSVSFDTITNSSRNTVETISAPGTTKIRGFEADLMVSPMAGLNLTASYAYTYTDIPPVLNPFSNVLQKVYIVFTPRNAASGSIDYSIPMGARTLRLHLDGNYADATQTFDQFATTNDKAFIMNARVAFADMNAGNGKLSVGLWSRNLLNEQHVYRRDPSNSLPGPTGSIANVMGDYGNFNAPRTVGLELSFKL
jgi:iron complex outermembrane receptor protein